MKSFRDSEENTDFHANFIVITTHEINLIATTLEVKEHQVASILKKPAKENQLNELLKKYVWNEHGD